MPDYDQLLDAEIKAFVEKTGRFYPPETASFSIRKQREVYDAMCRSFYAGRPENVRTQDFREDGLALRLYQNAEQAPVAAVLYLHGGGFVVGGLDSHDDICAEICGATGFDVVAVDYRLCPEHPHPAAFEDGQTALGWLRRRGAGRIVLAGDSAGANLAAALAHSSREQADIAGQVLFYPGLGGDHDEGSCITHADAPMLTRGDLEFYEALRPAGRDVSQDATFAPLRDVDFSGLPPTLALGAECDPLADDAPAYGAAICAAGGQAVALVEKGLVHGHLRARHSSWRAARSFARGLRAIVAMGEGRPIGPDGPGDDTAA